MSKPQDPRIVGVRAPTPEEEALARWFAEQRLKNPDTLDAAARQVVGLATGLLGLLFGVLSLSRDPLPPPLRGPLLAGLAALAVFFLLFALACSLWALRPRRLTVSSRLADQRQAFEGLVRAKARAVAAAHLTLFLGLTALGALLVLALLRTGGQG